MSAILHKYTGKFRTGRDLDVDDATIFLDELITSSDESILADVFRSWNQKGITADEIFSIARVMRERCVGIETMHSQVVDIVGTGGSRNKTFNVSTAAAFVIAGCGAAVAKHGNRAATSNTGSADVLAALGVEPAVDAATAMRCLDDIGICFMFAPNFHRLSPTLAKVRRGLGFPTIFNCVGPLCNPARAQHQVIGVWDRKLVEIMADALSRLGTGKSWIVHGSEGLDEISLSGSTFVAAVENASVTSFEIAPEDFGYEPRSTASIRVGSASESSDLILDILAGRQSEPAAETIAVINAAAALYVAGYATGLVQGVSMAIESIRLGRASEKLDQLVEATTI